MFTSINAEYNKKKNAGKADQFIAESVLSVDEVLPGSEEEFDDIVDTDSIPDEVYNKIDAELNKIINDPNYDDIEAEELVDGDDDIDDATLDAIIDECANAWYDNENINHPDKSRREAMKDQPKFASSSMLN